MSTSTEPDADFLAAFMPELPRLKAFIRSNVRTQSDADDVVQDVTLVLWRKFAEYDPSRPFRPWCFGVARNKLREFRRNRDRRVLEFDESVHTHLEQAHATDHGDDRSALRECLGKLDKRARDLITWRYDDGLALAEMEQRSGQSLKAISKTLGKLRANLAECMRRTLKGTA